MIIAQQRDPIELRFGKTFEFQIYGFMAVAVHGVTIGQRFAWYSKRVGLRIVHTIRSLHRRRKLPYRISTGCSFEGMSVRRYPGLSNNPLQITNPCQHNGFYMPHRGKMLLPCHFDNNIVIRQCESLANHVLIGNEGGTYLMLTKIRASCRCRCPCGFCGQRVEGF